MSKFRANVAASGGVNVVVLHGVLSRAPEVRVLPSGDTLTAYELTVPSLSGPAEGVSVVLPGPVRLGAALDAGDPVIVVGRVRRRFFRAGGTTQSRTEVVADKLVAARSPARARKAIEQALRRSLDEIVGVAG
jgi:single-strand DNA-binding protein